MSDHVQARVGGPLGFTWRMTLPVEAPEGGYRAIDVNADELTIHGSGQAVFWEWEGLERKCILCSFQHYAYRSISILNPDGSVGGWTWASEVAEA
jgi:hypothetical protein